MDTNESQRLVLAQLIHYPESANDVFSVLGGSGDQFDGDYRYIYLELLKEYQRSGFLDVLLVLSRMVGKNSQYANVVGDMLDEKNRVYLRNYRRHAMELWRENHIRRLQEKAKALIAKGERGWATEEALSEWRLLLEQSLKEISSVNSVSVSDSVDEAIRAIEQRQKNDGLAGVSSGIEYLDNIINGYVRGRLYVVTARPSMGKSAMLINNMFAAFFYQWKPLFFSLEMSRAEIGERLLGIAGGINLQPLSEGRILDMTKFSNAAAKLQTQCVGNIVEANNMTVESIRDHTKQHVEKAGKGHPVFIDYLQLLKCMGKFEKRYMEVGEISRQLKLLARECDCPVVLAVQLNREAQNVASPYALLSHLRESGNIEQDADVVIALTHASKSAIDAVKQKGYPQVDELVSLAVIKNRHGRCDDGLIRFRRHTQQFLDIDLTPREDRPKHDYDNDWKDDDEVF